MLCTSPRDAWQAMPGSPLVFRRGSSIDYSSSTRFHSNVFTALKLPCGQCLSCRVDRSRQDAVRCVHEVQTYDELGFGSSFITLTYADSFLRSMSLIQDDFKLFAYRLRSRLSYYGHGTKISIFYCGEYGERFQRPHFHAAIFGYDFPDKVQVEPSFSGSPQFDSEFLNDVWGKGRTRIGSLTFESAAYIARYTTKKVIGKKAATHYGDRRPEFAKYPALGLGRRWFEKYSSDVFPHDELFMSSKDGATYAQRPPRYYCKLLQRMNPDMFKLISFKRRERATEMDGADEEMHWLRQRQRRDYMLEKFKIFKRELEL